MFINIREGREEREVQVDGGGSHLGHTIVMELLHGSLRFEEVLVFVEVLVVVATLKYVLLVRVVVVRFQVVGVGTLGCFLVVQRVVMRTNIVLIKLQTTIRLHQTVKDVIDFGAIFLCHITSFFRAPVFIFQEDEVDIKQIICANATDGLTFLLLFLPYIIYSTFFRRGKAGRESDGLCDVTHGLCDRCLEVVIIFENVTIVLNDERS